MPTKVIVSVLFVVVSIIYPAIVYFGIQKLSPVIIAIFLFLLAAAKFYFLKDRADIAQVGILLVATIFSLILALSENELWLKLYPVVMSLCVAAVFFSSLGQEQSLIEKMARMSGKKISERAKGYTHRLTAVWGVLLLMNALVALHLALFASLAMWAFYCGVLSYIIFAVVFIAELVYRRYYIGKYESQ